ncbi:MAG: diadenylate cyclase CdaA [Planctomycetota bacterium]
MISFLLAYWKAFVEIAILSSAVFLIMRFVAGTRGFGVVRGFVMLLVLAFFGLTLVARFLLELPRIEYILRQLIGVSLVAVIVIFQPELRRGLMRLGQRPFWRTFLSERTSVVDELVEALQSLSRNRIGALIAFQRNVGLGFIIEGGIPLDSEITSELIQSIFWPGSPLHDGAAVILERRVAAAGCLLPLSENPAFGTRHGTRHRAAIGLTEETDAVCVVVSEETGRISFCFDGRIREDLPPDEVTRILSDFLAEKEEGY